MAVDVVLLDLCPNANQQQAETDQEEQHIEAENGVLHAAADLRIATGTRCVSDLLQHTMASTTGDS